MQDCWQENPDDRPMFENLRNDLKEMENQHQVKFYKKNSKRASSPFDVEVIKSIFFLSFSLQRLINMKHYDNILYAGMD